VPVNLTGLEGTLKAMRDFDMNLYKQMNYQIKIVMIPIRNKARGYAPDPQVGDLYNWTLSTYNQKITARSSMFRTFNTEGRVRQFPLYDATEVRKGILYRQGKSKRNSLGFSTMYSIYNTSAAGAIYETAGRKSGPMGDKASKSNNPAAGAQFIGTMGPMYGDSRSMRGRLIFRAWEEDQGRAVLASVKAIDLAIKTFNTTNTQSTYGLVS
jgi:hypothetical protein